MILSLVLVTVTPLRAQSAESRKNFENGFGIDLNRSYSGEEVAAILEVIAEEADRAIAESYDEGYKAASLRLKPEIACLEAVNTELKKDSEELSRKNTLSVPVWHVPLWACAGFVLGYGMRLGTEIIHR